MARANKGSRAGKLHPHQRRRLSEEGKRLLRHALAVDSERENDSVDFSIVSNRGDSSDESELESVLEWEQQQAGAGGRGKHRKAQYDAGNGENELDEAMEELMEKRDATKVRALQKILSLLRSEVLSECVQSAKVTLTSHTLSCLKKRTKESASLSLRVLSLVAITLGADEQSFFDDMAPIVQRIFTDRGDCALRVEAVYTLSIACFVCCPDDESKWELLEVLGSFLVAAKDAEDDGHDETEFPQALTVAVMECWAFVVSSFPPENIVRKLYSAQSIVSSHVAALAAFVRGGINPPVRSSACEVLALLVQFKYETSGDDGWTYARESSGSPLGGLETRIEAFMRESGKCIGKKNRKTQRSTLKDVLKTLRTGEGPHEDLQAESETLSVSTWSRFFQAHVLRRALQSGFQTHLMENELLREVFEVTENANAKMSMVSTAKRRADHRAKAVNKRSNRSRKAQAQDAFLYDE